MYFYIYRVMNYSVYYIVHSIDYQSKVNGVVG